MVAVKNRTVKREDNIVCRMWLHSDEGIGINCNKKENSDFKPGQRELSSHGNGMTGTVTDIEGLACGCVVGCRTCNWEVAASNLGRGLLLTKVYSAFHPFRVGK